MERTIHRNFASMNVDDVNIIQAMASGIIQYKRSTRNFEHLKNYLYEWLFKWIIFHFWNNRIEILLIDLISKWIEYFQFTFPTKLLTSWQRCRWYFNGKQKIIPKTVQTNYTNLCGHWKIQNLLKCETFTKCNWIYSQNIVFLCYTHSLISMSSIPFIC